jgi:hypothetical protein
MCGKQRVGIPIRDDRILESMRWIKRNVTKNEKGNMLVVCKEDYPAYKKRRDKYTSRQALYIAIGVIFMILGLVVSISVSTVLLSILIIAALYLLSLINYTPALRLKKPADNVSKNHKG